MGRSRQWRGETSFWRIYSSDLKRTKHTTQLLLRSHLNNKNQDAKDSVEDADYRDYDPNDVADKYDVIFDPRLRELAKGARQGLPKSWSYAEALKERQRRNENGEIAHSEAIPLLESEDDGWNRALKWLQELMGDVVQDVQVCNARDGSSKYDTVAKLYSVLAVGHAGIYRVILQRLLGAERLRAHPDAIYDKVDGRFAVPNTSLTILDLHVRIPDVESDGVNGDRVSGNLKHDSALLSIASIDIVLLTSTEHYSDARGLQDAYNKR